MRKPQPRDFGLSEAQVTALKHFAKETVPSYFGWSILAGAAVGFLVGVAEGGVVVGFVMLIPGAGVALFVGGVVAASWTAIAGFFSQRVRAYGKFTAAVRVFDAWDLRTRSQFWRSLSGRAFERELASLFERQGYKVELTPASGDRGIDILLKRSGKTTIVQCKQTAKPVGPAVVRELYGALISSRADEAILASVGGVTSGVQEFLSDKPIRVMGLPEIVRMHQILEPPNQ